MIWESAPTAAFVWPPSRYGLSVRQVAAAIQRYQPSARLQGLIDEMIELVEQTVLLDYQNKPSVNERALLADLRQEFQIFRLWHPYDIYDDLNALAGLLASDFALWAMPLDKISRLWEPRAKSRQSSKKCIR